MCVKEVPYWCKWLLALLMLVIGVLVLVFVFIGNNGGDASVVMEGQDNTSMIHQSNGIHLLEVSDSGVSGKCEHFTWSEWALMVLGVLVLLKVSHLLHYCLYSKRIVRKKMARFEAGLRNQPNVSAPSDVVVVPPLEMAPVVVPPLVMAPVV